jgi:thioesterase domain-containing protein/acyl carrier protein
MMPQHFIVLNELPLSPNGKLMRDRLPPPTHLPHVNASSNSAVAAVGEKALKIRQIFADVLNIDAETICCSTATFFALGGNSLTAIQLIYRLKSAFQKDVKIQDFFVSATVEGVSKLLFPDISEKDFASGASDSATDRIQLLSLHEGDADSDSIVFINPAGTSSLCYLDLIRQISKSKSYSIFALDDGVISSGGSMEFKSITEVATECVLVLTKKLILRAKKVHVIGWSYGGLVALELVKLLSSHANTLPAASVILIDAPISNSAKSDKLEHDNHDDYALDSLTRDVPQEELRDRIKLHFKECTELINNYNASVIAKGELCLSAPIVDIRPSEDSNCCSTQVLRSLTSAEVQRFEVMGNHWTMIFNNLSENVAKIIVETIDKT